MDKIGPLISTEIITRSFAKASGLKTYFNGDACPRGHIAPRTVSNGECVECSRARSRENVKSWRKRLLSENPEQYRAKRAAEKRARYARDPEKMNAATLAWISAHPEKRRETMRRWREKNIDHVAEYDEKWKTENPEKFREKCKRRSARRRGRKREAEGDFTAEDIAALFEKQNGNCVGCSEPLTDRYEIDHIMPLSRGGSNWPNNLQLLCRSCNAQKWAFTMDEWHARRGEPFHCSAA